MGNVDERFLYIGIWYRDLSKVHLDLWTIRAEERVRPRRERNCELERFLRVAEHFPGPSVSDVCREKSAPRQGHAHRRAAAAVCSVNHVLSFCSDVHGSEREGKFSDNAIRHA